MPSTSPACELEIDVPVGAGERQSARCERHLGPVGLLQLLAIVLGVAGAADHQLVQTVAGGLGGRHLGDHRPILHHVDPIAQRHDLVEAVRDEHEGRPIA